MKWQYTPRKDGFIAITLDNNAWDFLFAKKIDLAAEFPADKFALFMTREVEIESLAIPNNDTKAMLKDYISATILNCGIKTTAVFGFAHDGPGPQRVGGWDQGTWQSQTEREFYDAIRPIYLVNKSETNSQLTKNEGDAAVAAQSFFSVALTWERSNKNGPLQFAAQRGGKVLFLRDMDPSGPGLKASVVALHRA